MSKKWRKIFFTLCGAFKTLCIPAIWLIKGMFTFKVYCGGRAGSGKLVEAEKGSISFKYCTRHVKDAMLLWQRGLAFCLVRSSPCRVAVGKTRRFVANRGNNVVKDRFSPNGAKLSEIKVNLKKNHYFDIFLGFNEVWELRRRYKWKFLKEYRMDHFNVPY